MNFAKVSPPLHIAALKGHVKVVEALLNYKDSAGNSLIDINKKDSLGRTPLYIAALNGNVEMVNALFTYIKQSTDNTQKLSYRQYRQLLKQCDKYSNPEMRTLFKTNKLLIIASGSDSGLIKRTITRLRTHRP